MLTRRRRHGQRGQALVLVLAFMAFFGLVAMSVAALAKGVDSQRASTQSTASLSATTDGAGQFSMADVGAEQCGVAGGGTMSFGATADGLFPAQTLTYTLPATSCTNSSTGGNAPGAACELCLLNTAPANPATPVLTTNKTVTVNGEADANGSVSGTLDATGPNAKIGLYNYGPGGSTCSSCSPSPTSLVTPFSDPLSGRYPPPSSSSSQTCCASVISPGVYTSMNVTSPTFMKSGVYIATGLISIQGSPGTTLTNSDSDSGGAVFSDTGPTDSDGIGLTGASGTVTSDSGSGGTVTYANGTGSKPGTLTDSSKNWNGTNWTNGQVIVTLSNNTTETATVSNQTKSTLTMSSKWSPIPAAGNAYKVSTLYYTANTLVDTQQSWTNNQWQGDQVTVTLSNNATETAVVQSNTATTLTMTSNWTTLPSQGNAYKINSLYYTATTLVDTQKAWTANQWAGCAVTVTLSNNTTVTRTVQSNTTNTLTMSSAWSTVPSPGNAYVINGITYTANTLTDHQQAWAGNQWAGALVTVTLSNNTTETAVVQSNTATTLTLTTNWTTTPAPGNAYELNTLYYTANTLVDAQKSWTAGQWVGAQVTVTLSNNTTVVGTVQANNGTTMTMSSNWSTTPMPGNAYEGVTPVVIYLACPTSGPYWICPSSGMAGGSISVTGNARLDLTPQQTNTYAGLSIFADPNLTGTAIMIAGNGGSLTIGGTIYTPRATVNISGGGSSGFGLSIGGRLVAQSVTISGNANAQMVFTGTGGIGGNGSCYYYNETLSGANGSPQSPLPGTVLFEIGCGAAGVNTSGGRSQTTIISFSYGP